MRWQTTAALAVILLALGVFYYVYEIRLGPEREKAEAAKGRLFSVEAADVSEVEMRRAADTVKLRRAEGGWQLLEPVTARGDQGIVDSTVTGLVTARVDREIAAAPASLAEFGLDRPAADVVVTLKDGRQLGLQLGVKSPTGVWVYARERDKPAVFVLSDSLLRDATRPAHEFRDKTVLAFDRGQVTGFDVVTPDDTLAVEATGDGWRLTRPRALPADTETIGEFLTRLASARVKEFVAEAPRSLAPYGLERPLRLALHTGRDKDRTTRTLLLGRPDPGRQGVYAMRAGETSVLLLPDEVFQALPRTVAAARDKTVVAVERDRVKQVEIESPRGRVTLAREGDQWRITQPEPLPADPVEAGAVLMKLQRLRAQGFLSEDAAGIPRYLARPEVRLTLVADGAPPRTLLLAPAPDTRGGQPMAYAAVAGQGPVVLVEASALTELGRSVTDLRDRTLVRGLEPRDVRRIRVTGGGKSVVLERTGDTDWRVVEPRRGAARAGKTEELLWAIRALKWKELVAADGREPARYGLEAPAAEVGLYRPDGTAIAVLQVGKRDGQRLYVRLQDAPAVYAVDPGQLTLPTVDDLQG